MSQRNETTILLLTLIATIGLVAGGVWLFTKGIQPPPPGSTDSTTPSPSQPVVQDNISFGEEILVTKEVSNNPPFVDLKQKGVTAIAGKNYSQAVSYLQAALKLNPNAPETRIYLNNAQIGEQKSYTIAVAAPIGSDADGALEILRGVATAQNKINQAAGGNGLRLKVAIANDNNQETQAKEIATKLVNNSEVLGVVGHWASGVTLAAAPVYDSGKLVTISPISTSVKLSNISRYVFRTVPSDYVAARALANYMLKLQRKNAFVFFNSESDYSKSLKAEFSTAVSLQGGQILSEIDLSNSAFNAAQSVEQAKRQKADVLMLAADTNKLDQALKVVQVNQKQLNILAGDDVYGIKTLKDGGSAAEGMVVAVPWHSDAEATQSDFLRQSKQLWGGANVNWRTALSYDAVQALVAALERNPTRSGVQEVLSSPEFSTQGASGTIRFLPSGDRNAPVQLVKIIPSNSSRSGTGYDFAPVSP